MSDTENTAFQQDPLAYVQDATKPVDLLCAQNGYLFSSTLKQTVQQKLDAPKILDFVDAQGAVTVDFMPIDASGAWGGSWVGLRPCVKRMMPPNLAGSIASAGSLLDTPPGGVQGYYFPYKLGSIGLSASLGAIPEDVKQTGKIYGTPVVDLYCGWVDVPKMNPKNKFVFTGSMQGCELVVTESPASGAYYRIYHYQNASSNPLFRHRKWPGKPPVYWLNFSDYGVEGREDRDKETIMRAFAFNFFHFKGGRWHHVCQPLMYTTKWKGMEQQWVPALSDVKAPFERDIVDYGYQGDGPRQPAVLAPVPQPIRMGPCRSCDCRAFVAGAMKGFLPVCATCGHPHPAF